MRQRTIESLLALLLMLTGLSVALAFKQQPAPPSDLGFDVVSLTSDEALLRWHDGTAIREVGMSRVDFNRMFGCVHVVPLTPEKQAK